MNEEENDIEETEEGWASTKLLEDDLELEA
jgi:hypothetical protein